MLDLGSKIETCNQFFAAVGFWTLGLILDSGYSNLVPVTPTSGYPVTGLDLGSWTQDSGSLVQDPGCRIPDAGS
jgi:hypothetical protein